MRCGETNEEILKTEFCPPPKELILSLSISVTLTALLLAVVVATYYRYNTEIRVWLYAHHYCLWLVTEQELDSDKEYDAFISYCHQDEFPIIPELIRQLETGPVTFKLCLHFRDWTPGEFISRNIACSIAASRRTIIILSRNFITSDWGKMEFRTAHQQALQENRVRLIIILLGDIKYEDLDDELKAYLKTNTYLKWGEPWFWDKLRFALPRYRRKVVVFDEQQIVENIGLIDKFYLFLFSKRNNSYKECDTDYIHGQDTFNADAISMTEQHELNNTCFGDQQALAHYKPIQKLDAYLSTD